MKPILVFLAFLSGMPFFALAGDSAILVDPDQVQAVRAVLDPIILSMPAIEGSMIGGCIERSDKDPFFEMTASEREKQTVRMCLVYFSQDLTAKARVLAHLAELKIVPSVQIRFQQPFGKMVLQ